MQVKATAAMAAVLIFAAGAANAALFNVTAALKGGDEVPPNTTTGKGAVTATLDTTAKSFSYTVTYSGLTGPATAAHFHGPAAAGANAGVAVAIPNATTSPAEGSATLTDAQAADLEAGKYYVNVHTKDNPGGEIRGQVTK
jgi:CHRD domain